MTDDGKQKISVEGLRKDALYTKERVEAGDRQILVVNPDAMLAVLDVVEAAQRIREAMKNPDRDWLGLPPEASDEWVAGFFAALRSLDDNSYIARAVDRLEGKAT